MLRLVAGAALVTVAGCGGSPRDAGATCSEIPEETAGPYPGDGSNGPNVLTESGIVRGDITTSFGSASGVADGIPLTIDLTVLDAANGCTALPGAAVYVWHCTRDGLYSLYSEGATEENFLRGVQEADENGFVSFRTIFPGAYSGRWPHVHFEVYPSLDAAMAAGQPLATSQLALPQATCDEVYATQGYETSVRNLAQTSLESDMVFGDGYDRQLGAVTGDVASGLAVALVVSV